MDEARELAAQIVQLGDGKDKRLFLEAQVWAAAGSIWLSFQPEAREDGAKEFGEQLLATLKTIEAGQGRKPS